MINESPISLTNSAKVRMLYLLKNAPQNINGFRIKVTKSGCAGYKYKLLYNNESEINIGDEIINLNYNCETFAIYIDKITFFRAIGTKIDFVRSEFISEFTFVNQNAIHTCACGVSFALDKNQMSKSEDVPSSCESSE